ncbi:hypothetical protein RJ639_013998 [Escallonia herrerae]|uniref:MADS-box domain-containing protein n=1 Tax=Escallonia herrerae TaxID=1293975 RepID=A0AA89AKR8_9ASTE|nr:hypothetical protein RJ639_013998 [Escallonia herrerae]
MVRKKVNYQFIIDECARRRTFKKRKVGLLKKASELQTLCGVETCAIIRNSSDSHSEVWPSPHGASQGNNDELCRSASIDDNGGHQEAGPNVIMVAGLLPRLMVMAKGVCIVAKADGGGILVMANGDGAVTMADEIGHHMRDRFGDGAHCDAKDVNIRGSDD